MIKVVGVRFRTAGKIYFFDPVRFEIKKGDHVIVETARGIEFGTVVGDMREVPDDQVVQPLKPVLRIATERDKEQEAENKLREKEAYAICLEKIRKHGLEMKLIDAEYTFDNNKVLFYFTADGRIDFRELVKDLASVFKTRIELRQIGVRDETKTVGGIGICGRVLCCHSYLSDFIPVSIKMAKEQNLSLNPTKISGVCGRLMCCLKHEEDTYEELNRKLPSVGDYVTTEDGLKGEVQSVNVLRQLVKVIVEVGDEKEIREYETEKLRFKRKHGRKDRQENLREEHGAADLSGEELKALELLEKQESLESSETEQPKYAHQERGNQEKGNRGRRGDRAERGERSENTEKSEKTGRAERTEKPEKSDRTERPERAERRERGERQNKQERTDKNVDKTVEKTTEKPEGEKQETTEGGRRQGRRRADRAERGERQERSDRPERGERQNRGERPEKGERQERSDEKLSAKPEGEKTEGTEGANEGREEGRERNSRNRRNRNRHHRRGDGEQRERSDQSEGQQEGSQQS